jgi:hypothetical protein
LSWVTAALASLTDESTGGKWAFLLQLGCRETVPADTLINLLKSFCLSSASACSHDAINCTLLQGVLV